MNIFQELHKKQKKKTSGRRPIEEKRHYRENHAEFREWFDVFDVYYYGMYRNGKEWFDKVQDAHIDLRRKLGGIHHDMVNHLDKMEKPVAASTIQPLYNELREVAPLCTVDLTVENFRHPLATPKGVRVGKFMMERCTEYKINSEHRKQIAKIIERMGQKWANARVEQKTLYSRVDTSAKCFVLLGHYGVDNFSCFKQGGQSAKDKFTLAEREHTFVLTITENGRFSHSRINQDDTIARLWGFFNPQDQAVNFCNLYVDKTFIRGNAVEICRQQSAHILGVDVNDVNFHEDILQIEGIWHNKKSQNWTFYVGDIVPDTQILK